MGRYGASIDEASAEAAMPELESPLDNNCSKL